MLPNTTDEGVKAINLMPWLDKTTITPLWQNTMIEIEKVKTTRLRLNIWIAPLHLLKKIYTHKAFNFIVITHWGRVTHICVNKIIINGTDNALSPGRRQANIWTNDGILLTEPPGTNFNEILIYFIYFYSRKSIWKCRLENGGYFVSASMC